MKNKEEVVHTYNGILATEKNEILPLVTTWMELKGITVSDISQRMTDTV